MDFSSLTVDGQVVVVPVSVLVLANSPRLSGENDTHVRLLAELDVNLPPILVHRATMRVVDGIHRVKAATLRGQETIAARFFDGCENEAFVLSVRENIAHGLPLSVADRKAAAARIIASYPSLSDRVVAELAGLAASSVGPIRKRSTVHSEQLNSRIGRDGRVRPIDGAAQRQRVRELVAARPDAPLRQIAKEAHVSLGTAHAVRKNMEEIEHDGARAEGSDTEPNGVPASTPNRSATRRGRAGADPIDWSSVRRHLLADPTLRYTESGRQFLHWLDTRAISPGEWAGVVESIPPHWSGLMAGLARRFSQEWLTFADALLRQQDA